jgi:hypothetical protein
MSQPCTNCGTPDTLVVIDGVPLCDPCADLQVSTVTGMPTVGPPPIPIIVTDPDGHVHTLTYRVWRAPTGIEVELTETPDGDGYRFAVLGAHDHDIGDLVDNVRDRAEHEIANPHLEPNPHGTGDLLRNDQVAGRFVWQKALTDTDPFDVVIDGRTLTWHQFGQTMRSHEGWRFRLTIEDPCDDLRPDANITCFAERFTTVATSRRSPTC